MHQDWKASIAKIAYWKQVAHDLDKLGAFPWHFPMVAAESEKISQSEVYMGTRFSNLYRDFLSFADGWRGFCVTTDLFGTQDFLNGRAREVRKRLDVQEHLSSIAVSDKYVVPIGASDVDMDVFLLMSEDSPIFSGEVIWIAGAEVDRYPDFHEFFEAMVNYNARVAQNLAIQD